MCASAAVALRSLAAAVMTALPLGGSGGGRGGGAGLSEGDRALIAGALGGDWSDVFRVPAVADAVVFLNRREACHMRRLGVLSARGRAAAHEALRAVACDDAESAETLYARARGFVSTRDAVAAAARRRRGVLQRRQRRWDRVRPCRRRVLCGVQHS